MADEFGETGEENIFSKAELVEQIDNVEDAERNKSQIMSETGEQNGSLKADDLVDEVEGAEKIASDEEEKDGSDNEDNSGTEEQPPAVETEDSNIMARDFYDLKLNSYDEGPGQNLPQQHQPGAMAKKSNKTNRESVGVYLCRVPSSLTKKGVENLCKKFGSIVGEANVWGDRHYTGRHGDYKCATIDFATVLDAQNAIKSINDLIQQLGIWASFKRSKVSKKESADESAEEPDKELEFINKPKSQPIVIDDKEFGLPFTCPVNLETFEPKSLLSRKDWGDFEMLREFDCQPLNIFLENDQSFRRVTNGRVNYSRSPETDETTKLGTESANEFDAETHEFTHNGLANVCDTGDCKNCGNYTLSFCKGCKEFYCSVNCLKEYNSTKLGCSCAKPNVEIKAKKLNRNAAGRGGRLISPSTRIAVSSTTDSDAESTTSNSRKSQIKRLVRKRSDVRTVEPSELPAKNKLVAIASVISHKTVFLRSIERNDNERYLKYLNDVVECSKTAPKLNGIPKKGDIVLAEFEGSYYRAVVARVENDEAVVVFLEFGNVEKKHKNDLKELRDDLKYMKRFIFKAHLSDVNGGIKTDKCLTYLYQLLQKSAPLKFTQTGKVYSSGDVPCELVVSDRNESVNGRLNALNNIRVGRIVYEYEIPTKQLNSGIVVVVDNLYITEYRFVTVVNREHMSKMFLMHQRIQEYCKDPYESPYIPRKGEPAEICLAKCNGQWYRALCEKTYGDRNPLLMFIDFLVYKKVHIDNMRPMPAELKCTRYCQMADIGGTTDTTNMEPICAQLQLLSLISDVKVEQKVPNEPTIHFNLPEGAGGYSGSISSPWRRKRMMQSLLQSLNENDNESEK